MITAEGLAVALTPALIDVAHVGEPRPVTDVEFLEDAEPAAVDTGDLVLAVGVTKGEQIVSLAGRAADCAGLVVRARFTADPAVLAACREHGLTLLALEAGVAWSHVVWLMRGYVDRAGTPEELAPQDGNVYSDLFAMADTVSSIIQAPVTIEDAHSRVLSYSTGQHDVDPARLSTIVGRKVPRAVMAHFRSLGVFRQLARSDDPIFVPQGPDGVKPRFVVPVRAGTEWLGSIWAVVDEPVTGTKLQELRVAADVLALYLLRLRAQAEFSEQLHAEELRSLLRAASTSRPSGLGAGPWRVVALGGPRAQESVETRRALWAALARRRGWRQAQLTDLEDVVYAVVTDGRGEGPGSWAWFRDLVLAELGNDGSLVATAGGRVEIVAGLAESRAQAAEQLALGVEGLGTEVTSIEDCWAAVTVHRAVHGLADRGHPGPVTDLVRHDREHRTSYVDTLGAVAAYWGEPQRAAAALGVHPNSVRHRMARVRELVDLDLGDPEQRLAVRLQIAALELGGPS